FRGYPRSLAKNIHSHTSTLRAVASVPIVSNAAIYLRFRFMCSPAARTAWGARGGSWVADFIYQAAAASPCGRSKLGGESRGKFFGLKAFCFRIASGKAGLWRRLLFRQDLFKLHH